MQQLKCIRGMEEYKMKTGNGESVDGENGLKRLSAFG